MSRPTALNVSHLVKTMKQLHQRKGRLQQKRFLLEGAKLVREALSTGRKLDTVVLTSQFLSSDRRGLLQTSAVRGARVVVVSPEKLQSMTSTPSVPEDSVLATLSLEKVQSLEDLAPDTSIGVDVALQHIQDPGNVGSLVRSAAATNLGRVWLTDDCVDICSPKVVRSSAGQIFRTTFGAARLDDLVERYVGLGAQVIATAPAEGEESTSFWDVDFKKPTLILLGNEGQGLTSQVLQNPAVTRVRIPVASGVESLGVASCGALLLYEASRQRTMSQ